MGSAPVHEKVNRPLEDMEERRVKSRNIRNILFVAGGAAVGVAVTYFSAHSVTAASLSVGAIFGAIIGLFFTVKRQPGVG